jgi:hypothetical protein
MTGELDRLHEDDEERHDEFGCKKTLIGLVPGERPVNWLNVRWTCSKMTKERLDRPVNWIDCTKNVPLKLICVTIGSMHPIDVTIPLWIAETSPCELDRRDDAGNRVLKNVWVLQALREGQCELSIDSMMLL